jgi:hypothetical protein
LWTAALKWTRALRKATLRRAIALWSTALQRAVPLQRVRTLERIVALQRIGTRSRASTLLLLVLLLVLVLRILRDRRSPKPDKRSGDNTLRPKCNFIHKSHLVPPENPGISPKYPSRRNLRLGAIASPARQICR